MSTNEMTYCWDVPRTGRTYHLFGIRDGKTACGKDVPRCEVRRHVIKRIGCKECLVIAAKLNGADTP